MPKLICALILITVLGNPAIAQSPGEWRTYTSTAGRFSVRVPGIPTEEAADNKSPASHSFVLSYQDTAYILTYTDFPGGQVAKADAAAVLNAARDGGVKNVKGKLIAEQAITVSGYPGRDIIASVPLDDKQGSAHFRIVLAKGRLYMALFVGPGGSAGKARVDDFLKSFQILASEPADGWQTFTAADGRFTVRMPGMPKEEVSDLSGGGKIHQYALDKGDLAYIVSYNAIGGGAPSAAAVQPLLNKGRDAMVTSVHGKLVEEKPVSLMGNPGKAVKVTVPDRNGTAYVRSYIVGDQYYQVMLIGTTKALAPADVDRYFASFQLGAAVPPGDWKTFSSKESHFTVDLPGDPKQEKLPDGTNKFQAEAGSTIYIVVAADLPDVVTDPDKITGALEAAKDAEVKVLEGTALSQKRISLADVSGLQVNFAIPASKIPGGGSAIERFYLAGKHIYEVAVLTGNTKADETTFARFFNSFKLDAP